jgi:hypothetical protein
LIVVAFLAAVIIALKKIQDMSPEAKLKRAQEAAEKAAEAADRLAESY